MSENFDFDKKKPFVPVSVARSRLLSQNAYISEEHLEEGDKIAYEKEVDQMRNQLKEKLRLTNAQGSNNEPASDLPADEVYKKYDFGHRTAAAARLPIHEYKTEILNSIAEHSAVVIEGSTGCGKSTQVFDGCFTFYGFISIDRIA